MLASALLMCVSAPGAPAALQRRLLPLFPKEFGDYMLKGGQGRMQRRPGWQLALSAVSGRGARLGCEAGWRAAGAAQQLQPSSFVKGRRA